MKFENILLEILVNGTTLFFLFSSFVNIDLLRVSQIILLSSIIINAYLINKKVLRQNNKCNINLKQILTAFGIGLFNLIFFIGIKTIF